ncbi:tyrosine-type recombinase/integrase [Methylohalobius crimeensis]|uniref:tyrosine-type recombinase/integrase n=1 Tax=Methylohalobius crimeensis TaxID=244365 RepID=UPI0003B4DCD0|nr:integrase arm-type DNA-binding domain-containing protein [Methylohalobius crimeensis]
MALTVAEIKNAKPRDKSYKVYDEKGLYLEVLPSDSKKWRFRYRRPGTGKENRLSLGSWPDVSLKEARQKRDEARKLLDAGIDPSQARQMEKQKQAALAANSFEAVARDWKERHLDNKSESHRKRTWGMLDRCVFPYIGRRPLTDISAPDILAVARIHEKRGALETAHRCIQVIGQVFRYGMAVGVVFADPTPALKGALPPVKTRHMAAPTDPVRVGDLLRVIDAFSGSPVVSVAIRLLPLVFVRPGELRTMKWEDLDMEAAEWRYTTSKTGTEHLVPLSGQAVELIEEIRPLTGHLVGGWVFPGGRSPLKPLSEAAINAAYKRLGIDTRNELTGHGWRATARTLLHEQLGYRPEVIEHQLAHAVPDTLGRAYNRTRFLEQRREMLQAWADYLDGLRAGGNVVPIRQVKA